MLKKSLLLLLLLPTLATAQTPSAPPKKEILLTVEDTPVTTEEFLFFYEKNRPAGMTDQQLYTPDAMSEYLSLFTQFKLKVAEAYRLGLDQSETFQAEYRTYREQLLRSFLTDREYADRLLNEAYERMQEEIQASHILVRVEADATPADTLQAWEKINALAARIRAGEDFEQIAYIESEDPSARSNRGYLGYFSAMQMVYEFEQTAWSTPVGQVSQPFKTKFGYHLLKVSDRRPNRGRVTVGHLFLAAARQGTQADEEAYRLKLEQIRSRLAQGESWSTLCQQFSEDPSNRDQDGLLREFGTGEMPEAFADAAFALKNTGDISAPVRSPFGWHLIRLQSKRPIPPFAEIEGRLRNGMANDGRAEIARLRYFDKLRDSYQVREEPAYTRLVLEAFDSTLVQGLWKPAPNYPFNGGLLLTVQEQTYTTDDFVAFVLSHQRRMPGLTPFQYGILLFRQWQASLLARLEEQRLLAENSEYALLEREYREGLLLFQLMEQQVWNRAQTDSVALQQFFGKQGSRFRWGKPRANVLIFSAETEQILNQALTQADSAYFILENVPELLLNFAPGTIDIKPEQYLSLAPLLEGMSANPGAFIQIIPLSTDHFDTPTDQLANTLKLYLTASRKIPDSRVALQPNNPLPQEEQATVLVRLCSRSATVIQRRLTAGNPLALTVREGNLLPDEDPLLEQTPLEKGLYKSQQNGRFQAVLIREVLPLDQEHFRSVRGYVMADFQNHLEQEWVGQLRKRFRVRTYPEVLERLVKQVSE